MRKEMPGKKPTEATLATGSSLPSGPSSAAAPVNHGPRSSGSVHGPPAGPGGGGKDTEAQSWPQTGRSCPTAWPGLAPGPSSSDHAAVHCSPTAATRASAGPSQGPARMPLEGSSGRPPNPAVSGTEEEPVALYLLQSMGLRGVAARDSPAGNFRTHQTAPDPQVAMPPGQPLVKTSGKSLPGSRCAQTRRQKLRQAGPRSPTPVPSLFISQPQPFPPVKWGLRMRCRAGRHPERV